MVRGPRFREDLLELPEVADEQALRGSAVELGDSFDNALEISAHRVGKLGPRWTEAAHRADARAKCYEYSKVNVISSVNILVPSQCCRARTRGNSGRSFDGAFQAAQEVRRTGADIRKHDPRCANPAFRERTERRARRPRRRSRGQARRALVPRFRV